MCRRSDSLKRKSAVSNGKAACGAGFRRKGGIMGDRLACKAQRKSKILSQRLRLSFESVVDFIDTLNCRLMTENFAWQNGFYPKATDCLLKERQSVVEHVDKIDNALEGQTQSLR